MKLLRDRRATIWGEIVELISLKQLRATMGCEYRSWMSKAERIKQVSKSKKVHALADKILSENTRNPEANANLISAAPDLLDMLTVCLGYIEADDDHDPKFANQIKAVIKKARGET